MFCLLALCGVTRVWAESLSITVSVTVVTPPPCVINNNKTIDVDFGSSVSIPAIDGQHYQKNISYTVVCTGATSNAMKMQISGTATAFDSTALQTTKTGLGVALRKNGNPLNIGDWFNFTYPTLPTLQAVLVKKSGATLNTGDFSAAATLAVEYQ
ncbi:fimbrial protein [Enterobacter cloacae]|uniref:fimbrial protein n=1 Tax=Enterobacter cloacae TaxID=550 RepID=UPI0034A56FE0